MKISSMTSRQLAFPLSCCKSYPWWATKCLCGEYYPTEMGVPSMKETWAMSLYPESFLLHVLLAPKFQNTAQECVPKEGWGHQAGGCWWRVDSSALPFFILSSGTNTRQYEFVVHSVKAWKTICQWPLWDVWRGPIWSYSGASSGQRLSPERKS